MDHVNIIGHELSRNPDLVKHYEKLSDSDFMVYVVVRYLAMARVRMQKTADLPEHKKNADSQIITGEEISKDVDALKR